MAIETSELREILNSVLGSQQPFFADLLNRLSAHEAREIHRDEKLQSMSMSMELLAAQENPLRLKAIEEKLDHRFDELEARLHMLENERTERGALTKAMKAIPAAIGWLIGAIGLAVGVVFAKQHAGG